MNLDHGQSVHLVNKPAPSAAGGDNELIGLEAVFKEVVDDQAKKISIIVRLLFCYYTGCGLKLILV